MRQLKRGLERVPRLGWEPGQNKDPKLRWEREPKARQKWKRKPEWQPEQEREQRPVRVAVQEPVPGRELVPGPELVPVLVLALEHRYRLQRDWRMSAMGHACGPAQVRQRSEDVDYTIDL